MPTADAFDPEALEGILGLQVHSGQDTKVRFRNLRMHAFGAHAWNTIDAKGFVSEGVKLGDDFGLRLTRGPEAGAAVLGGWRLCFRGERRTALPKATELVQSSDLGCSIALADPRLAKEKHEWQQLVLLAYGDRIALYRDHELVLESRAFRGPDGPLVWIERPTSASEATPFARVESLQPATR